MADPPNSLEKVDVIRRFLHWCMTHHDFISFIRVKQLSHQPAKPRLAGAEKLHEITTVEAGRAVTEARHQKDSVLYSNW